MVRPDPECVEVEDCPIPMERRGWHLKREIQLGHIITTLTVAVSVVVYVGKQDQRIALIELAHQQQAVKDKAQDDGTLERISTLRGQLDRLESKLDRLIERYGDKQQKFGG